MRRVVDFRLVVLLVFFFLYRFVNVGFNAMVIYHAYSIVHSAWGSALAVSVLILGSTVGLLVTGLYVLYSVRPQVLMLTLMMLREILLLNFVLFSPLTRELSLLLPVLLIYSTALWIERSILGGIAIENVPSIARGLNALNIIIRAGWSHSIVSSRSISRSTNISIHRTRTVTYGADGNDSVITVKWKIRV